VGYSYAPLRFMSYLGMLVAVLGFVYALAVLIDRLFFAQLVQGWTSLMLVVLILGGLNMMMLGIIGEYLWRTLDEARGRPRYVLETTLNVASAAPVAQASGPAGGARP